MDIRKTQLPRNISQYDLIRYGVNTDDKTQLEAALWQLGVDVKKGIEAVECEHTTATGIKVNGVYYLGSERFDREWVMSGYASFEARLISKGDLSMIKEVANMSKVAMSLLSYLCLCTFEAHCGLLCQ